MQVWGNSLVVQWLRLGTYISGGTGSIPGWGTKIPYNTGQGKTRFFFLKCKRKYILNTARDFGWVVCLQFSSVQSLSCVRLCDPMNPACQASLSITKSRSLPKLCPSGQWCHPSISSSVVPFPSCPQCLLASGSFLTSQLFTSGGQSTRVSASASVLPMNTRDWCPLEWTSWISLHSKDSQESSPTLQFKSINFSVLSFLHSPTLTSIHDHWKNHSLD